MTSFFNNLPHMIMGLVAIIAVTALSLHGTISGGEALGVIGAATGFTMGVGGTSASNTAGTVITPATSVQAGQTLKETTTHELSAVPSPTAEA